MEEYDAAEKVTAAAEQELTTAVDTVLDSSKGAADAPEPIGMSTAAPSPLHFIRVIRTIAVCNLRRCFLQVTFDQSPI